MLEFFQEVFAIVRPFWVVWLLFLFTGIVVWACWPTRKAEMEDHARIPLRDDEAEG